MAYESSHVKNMVAITNGSIIYSINIDTGSPVFVAASITGTPTGNYCGVVATPVAYVAVTDTGKVLRATVASLAGGFTVLGTTFTTGKQWRLSSDNQGNVIAWARNTTGQDWYISTDDGATWASLAHPPIQHVTSLRYIDGSWFLTSTDASYIATSNDASANSWLRLPTPYDDSAGAWDLSDVLYSEGALIALGDTFALVSQRASDLSPQAFTPASTPVTLYDAGYLQSEVLDSTTPDDGATLVYDYSALQWRVKQNDYVQSATDVTIYGDVGHLGITNTGALRTVTLSTTHWKAGDRVSIKDESNGAATHNIVITPTSGLIEGGASYSITTNRGGVHLYFNGTDFFVTAKV
jgi:hypothetical protein